MIKINASIVALVISLTNANSMDNLYTSTMTMHNNPMQSETLLRYGNDFNSEQLQELVQQYCDFAIVNNNPSMPYDNNETLYGIYEHETIPLVTVITQQQLTDTINELFTNTCKNLTNTKDSINKLKVAEAFYRIVYHPYKLLFILNNNDINTFKIINNILEKLQPLCKEHAVANIGPKQILYGLDKLNASLPTINAQFANGLNFDIDLTRMDEFNERKFKQYYIDMLSKTHSISGCFSTQVLEYLINLLNNYSKNVNNNSLDLIKTINNLNTFFKENLSAIKTKINNINNNMDNLFKELLEKQKQNITFNALIEKFDNVIKNSNNLNKNDKSDVFRAFFNRLFCNKKVLSQVIEIKDKNKLNTIKYLLKREDVKQVNMYDFMTLECDKIWKQICEQCEKGELDKDKKLEIYQEFIAKQSMGIFHGCILPLVECVNKTKNIDKELQDILLDYYSKIASALVSQGYKYKKLCDNKTALVPENFWKKPVIDYKKFEHQNTNQCLIM